MLLNRFCSSFTPWKDKLVCLAMKKDIFSSITFSVVSPSKSNFQMLKIISNGFYYKHIMIVMSDACTMNVLLEHNR